MAVPVLSLVAGHPLRQSLHVRSPWRTRAGAVIFRPVPIGVHVRVQVAGFDEATEVLGTFSAFVMSIGEIASLASFVQLLFLLLLFLLLFAVDKVVDAGIYVTAFQSWDVSVMNDFS